MSYILETVFACPEDPRWATGQASIHPDMGPVTSSNNGPVFRILDVNLNRLREALRVVEEYARFIRNNAPICATLKGLRHSLEEVEREIGRGNLLANRDTQSDPFAGPNRPEEMVRRDCGDVLHANLKRAQEAARVIEEYVKVAGLAAGSDIAKSIRFTLYALEKSFVETP